MDATTTRRQPLSGKGEVGFAHGRNKQTVCIQEGNIDLPFDMGHNRTLTYTRNDNGLNGLTQKLTLVIQNLSLSL